MIVCSVQHDHTAMVAPARPGPARAEYQCGVRLVWLWEKEGTRTEHGDGRGRGGRNVWRSLVAAIDRELHVKYRYRAV